MKKLKADVDEIRQKETELSSKKMDEDQKLKAVEQRLRDKTMAIDHTKNKVCGLKGNFLSPHLFPVFCLFSKTVVDFPFLIDV